MIQVPRLATLLNRVNSLEDDVTVVQGSISSVQGSVSSVQSTVTTLNGKVNVLTGEQIADYQFQSISQVLMPSSKIGIGTSGLLADAVIYQSGNLVFDFANGTGDNGLDTGSEASSQWYALYAVPNTANTAYILKATTRHPISQPGPTGYTKWRYLGLIRNGQYHDSNISDLAQFFKVGPLIQFWNSSNGNATGIRYAGSSGPVTTVSNSFNPQYAMSGGESLPFNGARYGWTLTQVPSGGSTAIASLTSKFWNASFAMTGTITMAAGNSGGPNSGYGEFWCDSTNVTQIATATTLALASGQMNWSLNLNTVFDPVLLGGVR